MRMTVRRERVVMWIRELREERKSEREIILTEDGFRKVLRKERENH